MKLVDLTRQGVAAAALLLLASCGGGGGGGGSNDNSAPTASLYVVGATATPRKTYVGYTNDAPVTITGALQVTGGTAVTERTNLVDSSGRTVATFTTSVAQSASNSGTVGYSLTLDPRGLTPGTYSLQFAVASSSGVFSTPYPITFNIVANAYQSLPAMPTARSDFTITAVGSKIYALTGSFGAARGGVASALVEVFDTATNLWTIGVPAPTARIGATSASVGTKIYVIGGYNATQPTGLSSVDVFDTSTSLWTTTTPAPTARFYAGATAIGTDIFVVDGTRDPADLVALATAERLDTLTNIWSTLPNSRSAESHPVVTSISGKVYVAGGISNMQSFGGSYEYDPAAAVWSDAPEFLIYGRTRFAGAIYNNLFYAFGGDEIIPTPPLMLTPTAKAEADPTFFSSTSVIAPLPAAVDGVAGVTLNGAIYIIGSSVTYRYPPGADVL